MDEKTAEEKLETKKLDEVDQLPYKQRRPDIRFAVVDPEKRIFRGETFRQGHEVDERQHDRHDGGEELRESGCKTESKAVIGEAFAADQPDPCNRDRETKDRYNK